MGGVEGVDERGDGGADESLQGVGRRLDHGAHISVIGVEVHTNCELIGVQGIFRHITVSRSGEGAAARFAAERFLHRCGRENTLR